MVFTWFSKHIKIYATGAVPGFMWCWRPLSVKSRTVTCKSKNCKTPADEYSWDHFSPVEVSRRQNCSLNLWNLSWKHLALCCKSLGFAPPNSPSFLSVHLLIVELWFASWSSYCKRYYLRFFHWPPWNTNVGQNNLLKLFISTINNSMLKAALVVSFSFGKSIIMRSNAGFSWTVFSDQEQCSFCALQLVVRGFLDRDSWNTLTSIFVLFEKCEIITFWKCK